MKNRLITKAHDLLANVKEIPWLDTATNPSSHLIKTEVIPGAAAGNSLFIGHDWYAEKYEMIASATAGSIIIDAGCHKGHWFNKVKNIIPFNVKYIGIDPCHYPEIDLCTDNFLQVALDDVDQEGEHTFHIFDEPGCNSLLSKSEHLTMRNVVDTITVKIKSLESVLKQQFNIKNETIIQYLKVDCQGKDINVVKSLRSFLPYTKYIQIESSFNQNMPFYENQPSYEFDIETMKDLGFEPILWMEYAHSPLPEGEIIFRHRDIS